jgi:tellurite resistance protein TehA-like permease
MASLSRALSYLIAAQFQAVGLILVAWWGGNWLNEQHPLSFNWYAITFPVATLAVAQTFYVVIRHALRQAKGETGSRKPAPPVVGPKGSGT